MNAAYEPPAPMTYGLDWWGIGAGLMVGGAVALAWIAGVIERQGPA